MKKKLLKQLVLESYDKGHLLEKKALLIADQLDRKELKQYISALKQSEKLRTVFVDMPFDGNDDDMRSLQSLFPDKKIVLRTEESLLAGMRIVNNDDIFEMNLKHNLDAIIEHVAGE
jgi:mRNA-degrading endonuclease YafQ of YafQ-DinJ toxin-antitoxin module